jgi:hypothetical protein
MTTLKHRSIVPESMMCPDSSTVRVGMARTTPGRCKKRFVVEPRLSFRFLESNRQSPSVNGLSPILLSRLSLDGVAAVVLVVGLLCRNWTDRACRRLADHDDLECVHDQYFTKEVNKNSEILFE